MDEHFDELLRSQQAIFGRLVHEQEEEDEASKKNYESSENRKQQKRLNYHRRQRQKAMTDPDTKALEASLRDLEQKAREEQQKMSKQEDDLHEQEQKQIDVANEQLDKLANLLSRKEDKQDALNKKKAAKLQECKQKSEKYVQDMQNRYQATLEVYRMVAATKALPTPEATPAKLQARTPSTPKTPLVSLLVCLGEGYEVLFLTHSCFTGSRHPAWIQLSHRRKQPQGRSVHGQPPQQPRCLLPRSLP